MPKYSIPFVGGLDTKTDEQVLQADRLAALENGEFTKHGKVRTRPGFAEASSVPLAGTTINGVASTSLLGDKLGVATRGNELLTATTARLYSYDSAGDRQMLRSRYCPMTHEIEELGQVNAGQSYAHVASAGNLTAAIWEDSRGGVRYSLYNNETGAAYAQDVSIATSNASRPYVVPLGDNLVLLWAEHSTNEIRGRVIRTGNIMASVAASYTTYVADLAASRQWAVATDGEYMYLAYKGDGSVVGSANDTALAKISAFGTTAWKKEVTTDAPTCLDLSVNESSQVTVCWYDGIDVYVRTAQTSTGAFLSASASIKTVAAVERLAAGYSSSGTFAYAWEVPGASADLNQVTIRSADAAEFVVLHSHLVSSGFKVADRPMFILGHDSRIGLQNSYYLYTDEGFLCGQLLYQTALDRPSADHLTRVFDNITALGFKRRLDAEGTSAVFTHQGIAKITFNQTPQVSFAEAGGTTYLSGSMLWAYDGQAAAEACLTMYPDVQASDATAGTAAGAGLVDSASYSYKWFWTLYRANGERVRSAALIVTKSTGAGGGGADDSKLTWVIPTISHTRWRDDYGATLGDNLTDLVLEGYRTIANDTTGIYYKITGTNPATVSGSNRWVYNDPTANTITLVDEMTDAALISNEVDYLTRGEIEHITPPGPALLAAVGDRVYLAGGGIRKNTVWYSKLRFFGEPAQFSDLLVLDDLPETTDSISKLTYINESLVILKTDSMAVVVGDGVDNTNTSGAFQSQTITADLGCSGAACVVPGGVMLASNKGIFQLDQSFSLKYVGDRVEAYNAQTYTGATVIPGTNQVLFLAQEGLSVMYDYAADEWAAWTVTGTSIATWNDTIALQRTSDAGVLYRDPTLYTDGGSNYRMYLRTGQARLDDSLQGSALCRKMMLLGRYVDSHRLRVGIIYNNEAAAYETFTWDPSTVITVDTWGDDATWGSGDYWGGSLLASLYRFEHRPKRSKFSTIQFEFTVLAPAGAGCEFTELTLEVEPRTGLDRIAATRKY